MAIDKEILLQAAAQYEKADIEKKQQLQTEREHYRKLYFEMIERCSSLEVRALLEKSGRRILFGSSRGPTRELWICDTGFKEQIGAGVFEPTYLTPYETVDRLLDYYEGKYADGLLCEETFWRKITDIVDNIRVINSCSNNI